MKFTLLIFLCGLQSFAFGHDYFFAFAEVEYNDVSQKFEATISASTHDMERIFENKGWSIDALESLQNDTENFTEISNWLLDQFSISSRGNYATFTIIGCEIELTGMIHFYIESAPIQISNSLTVEFDLLMDHFPEQQNKLTLYYRDQTITESFLPIKKSKEIKLENS